MNRSECLDKAKEIVNGARQENYGSPEKNFKQIAKYWSIYLDRDISETDVALMMVLMKLTRLQNKPDHDDSWIDIAGYAANGAELSKVYDDRCAYSSDEKLLDEWYDQNHIKVKLDLSPVECKELK